MIKTAALALALLLATGCAGQPVATTPAPPVPVAAPTPTPDQSFVQAIQRRLAVDDTIPAPAKQTLLTLYQRRSTVLFPDNPGLVLSYEVLTTPAKQAETTQTAVLLMGTAVSVAQEQGLPLTGVEVIFYAGDRTNPFIGFRAEPPWGVENILATPLSLPLIEAIQQQDTAATVTPTPSPTPVGQQSG